MKFYSCGECDNLFYSYQENLDVKCCDKGLIELDVKSSLDNHNLNIKMFANYLIIDNKNIKNDIHFVEYIIIETNHGYYYRKNIDNISFRQFLLNDENIVDIYYNCNIHGVRKINWDLVDISSVEEIL